MRLVKKLECKFFTATVLEWKYLLKEDTYKEIILNSLQFLVTNQRAYVHAFVIMDNHVHILWSIRAPHLPSDVQRDFLRFTSHAIVKHLKTNDHAILKEFEVNTSDRKHQIWERNALTIDLWDEAALIPKLNYIHNNPVKAGLCSNSIDYKYSSADFYETGENNFGFLSHYL